jgi:hypothetical protein
LLIRREGWVNWFRFCPGSKAAVIRLSYQGGIRLFSRTHAPWSKIRRNIGNKAIDFRELHDRVNAVIPEVDAHRRL